MNIRHHREHGVGIVEVMMALAVLMFAALSISNLQTATFLSMAVSDSHFSVNEQTQDMLELLRSNVTHAKNGDYNFDYDDVVATDGDSPPVLLSIGQWKLQINDDLPRGAGKINCINEICTVSVRWTENINGAFETQYFNIAGPV